MKRMKQVGDEVCEHTVFLARNDCGLICLAEHYHSEFMAAAKKILTESGEPEDVASLTLEYFPL